MLNLKKLTQEGLGLIETILALAVAVIVITSMVSLAVFTLRASLQNKLLLSGTQFASQEIELMRAFRDSNTWADYIAALDASGGDCFVQDCHMDNVGALAVVNGQKTAGSGAELITTWFRVTDMSSGGDNSLIRVAVTVRWQIGTDYKYAHNYTELSNWRAQ